MSFTPRPWITQKLDRTNHPSAQERGMLSPYRILSTSDRGCEEVAIVDGESDARLIAAAPELLEACQALAEWSEHSNGTSKAVIHKAKAAIEKAVQ